MNDSPVALNAKGPRARYGFRTEKGKSKSGTIRAREDVRSADLQAIWLTTVEVAGTFPDIGSYIQWLKRTTDLMERIRSTMGTDDPLGWLENAHVAACEAQQSLSRSPKVKVTR